MGLNVNYAHVSGNLTADPEKRFTQDGTEVSEFTVAYNDKRKDKTSFFPVVVYGKKAEICNKMLSKGDHVFVAGELEENRWQTKDGARRSKIRYSAEKVDFIDLRCWRNQTGNGYGGPQ